MARKCTIKSVNEHLPRRDSLTRYIAYGTTGVVPQNFEFLKCAYADYDDEDCQCWKITLYGGGDALTFKHYYEDKCADITDIIYNWLFGDHGYPVSRHDTCAAIAEAITEQAKEETAEES